MDRLTGSLLRRSQQDKDYTQIGLSHSLDERPGTLSVRVDFLLLKSLLGGGTKRVRNQTSAQHSAYIYSARDYLKAKKALSNGCLSVSQANQSLLVVGSSPMPLTFQTPNANATQFIST